MGLGLQGAYGAQGGEDALQEMIKAKLQQEATARQIQQQQIENDQRARVIGQGDQRIAQEQKQLDLAGQPKPAGLMTLSPGASIYDPSTGAIRATAPTATPAPARPISLSPGARLVDPTTGRLITSAPDRPQAGAGTPGGPALADGVTGDAALEGQDEKTKNIVKLLTDYKIQLPSGMALKTPEWQNYLSLARAYDPSFDAAQYGTRVKLRGDFTSGTGARNIRSLNTAIAHLDTLQQKADALGNTGLPVVNSVKNFFSQHAGDPSMTGFQNAATAVENELANAFKGTGATDQEVKSWRQGLNASESPAQFKEGINTAINLIKGRISALQDQYGKGMGKPADFQMVSPESQTILDRLSGGSAAGSGAAPASTRKTARNPTTGEVVYSDDGGKTWHK